MKIYTMGNGLKETNARNKHKSFITIIVILFALALSVLAFAGMHGIKANAAIGVNDESDYPNFVIKNNVDNTTTRTGLTLKRDKKSSVGAII